MSNGHLSLDVGPARAWTHGRITAFVARHPLAWELASAGLTLVYVVLAFLQDQGSSRAVTVALYVLVSIFVVEFSLRLYDSQTRSGYLRNHWLDIVTCVPVVGPLRALRLIRLLAFVRLGANLRSFGIGVASSERVKGGTGLWVLAPILLLVWAASAYGYYELEGGINPRVHTFSDALYFAFVTASTVGYGDVTPITSEGKILTGVLIFVGIGLLGFASAQLTAKLMPQRNEIAEMKATLDNQVQLLQELNSRLDALTGMLEARSSVAVSREAQEEVSELL